MSTNNAIFTRRNKYYRLYDGTPGPPPAGPNYVDLLFVQDAEYPLFRPRGEEELRLNQDRADACMGYQQQSDLPIFQAIDISITIEEHELKSRQVMDFFSNPKRLNPWEINGVTIVPVTDLGSTIDLDGNLQPHVAPCDPQRQDLVNMEIRTGPSGGANTQVDRYLGIGFESGTRAQGQPNTLTFNGKLYGAILPNAQADFTPGVDVWP